MVHFTINGMFCILQTLIIQFVGILANLLRICEDDVYSFLHELMPGYLLDVNGAITLDIRSNSSNDNP